MAMRTGPGDEDGTVAGNSNGLRDCVFRQQRWQVYTTELMNLGLCGAVEVPTSFIGDDHDSAAGENSRSLMIWEVAPGPGLEPG